MIYRQGDPQWGHLLLGYGPDTIGESGCYLSVFAQILLHYGFSVDPRTLNQLLKDNNRWINGDLLSDGAIAGMFPGVGLVTKWDFTNRPADLSVLTNNATDEYAIEVDFDHNPNDGIQTHFVRFVSYIDGVLIIDDPEYGEEANFTKRYGTNLAQTILKIVKYTGPAAPVAAAPAPVPAAVNTAPTAPLSGTAHVIAPANVRTGPGTNFGIDTSHSSGKLAVGTDFVVTGEVVGEDPYGDGRNKWVVSQFGHFIWEGNVTLNVSKGGEGNTTDTQPETVAQETPVADTPAAPADVQAPAAPAAEAATTEPAAAAPAEADPEVKPLGFQAWLKPTLNDLTRQHEGAPVVDIATGNAVEVLPSDAKAAFVAVKTVNGVNYLMTQNMLDKKLDYGIDGLNLENAAAPANIMGAAEAATATPETAQPDQYVEDALEGVGKIWRTLLDFLNKHHPNNKETK